MVTYSHSRLSMFEQCSLKYKFRYIDKIPPDYQNSIEAFLGKKVHDTLEWVYNNSKVKDFELDDIIKYYLESWTQDFNSEIKIVKKEFNAEYYFNKGIRFLINYFLKHAPFKDNTVETEKKIVFSLTEKGNYNIIGYIDRLVHHKETNIFEIHDYKTGAVKSQYYLDQDRQLALYSLAIKEYYEEVNDVHLIWHFLDSNEEKTSKRTLEDLEKLKRGIISLIDKVEATKEFIPNPSTLCNWCEYRSNCHFIKENPSYPN